MGRREIGENSVQARVDILNKKVKIAVVIGGGKHRWVRYLATHKPAEVDIIMVRIKSLILARRAEDF
jgi:spermidine synthase